MNTDKQGNTTYVQDEGPGNGMWGLKPQKVGPTQIKRFQLKVTQMVWMKADKLLGVGRERVRLLSVDAEAQTAQIEVPDWGEETTPLYSLVPLTKDDLLVFIEIEEQQVKLLEAQPSKAGALSKQDDSWEFRVRNVDGREFWIFQDDIMVTNGKNDDPFIF